MELLEQLRTCAMDAGASGFGVADAAPFGATRKHMEERRESGLHAGMSFTYTDPERSTDIRATHPWATRLVVLAWSYLPPAGDPGPAEPGTGRIARFATDDHYRPLRRCLADLATVLQSTGYRAEVLCDDNRLVDRAAAVRAGVGWWGKNTMVLRPGDGPWTLLGTVVTDALLPESAPMKRDCGTCSACIPACPTGALVAPGVLDARRCLAYLLQSARAIPHEFRTAVGDRIYGCDDCLEACPPGSRLMERSPHRAGRLHLLDILSGSDEELLARFGHFYIPRRRPRYLRRNALVALGNVGDERDVGAVVAFLDDPDPQLRSHAAWAIGRLGGHAAHAALESAIHRERDETVRAEIERAMAGVR